MNNHNDDSDEEELFATDAGPKWRLAVFASSRRYRAAVIKLTYRDDGFVRVFAIDHSHLGDVIAALEVAHRRALERHAAGRSRRVDAIDRGALSFDAVARPRREENR